MKDKKTRLWWADRLRIGLIIGLILMAMFAYAGSVVCLIGMFVMSFGFCAVEFMMNRCPRCDRHLDRNWGRFCQHCGGRIREDKTES